MVKYTEEQLLEYKDEAHIPQPQILEAFNQLVESVAIEFQMNKANVKKPNNGDTFIDEHGNERPYTHMNRRRGSRSGAKPNLKKKANEVQVDDDGWATLTDKQKKSFSGEDEELEAFREAIRDSMKVKPNNKNLGSSKAVDAKDTIADKQTITFNAFEALGDGEADD